MEDEQIETKNKNELFLPFAVSVFFLTIRPFTMKLFATLILDIQYYLPKLPAKKRVLYAFWTSEMKLFFPKLPNNFRLEGVFQNSSCDFWRVFPILFCVLYKFLEVLIAFWKKFLLLLSKYLLVRMLNLKPISQNNVSKPIIWIVENEVYSDRLG